MDNSHPSLFGTLAAASSLPHGNLYQFRLRFWLIFNNHCQPQLIEAEPVDSSAKLDNVTFDQKKPMKQRSIRFALLWYVPKAFAHLFIRKCN